MGRWGEWEKSPLLQAGRRYAAQMGGGDGEMGGVGEDPIATSRSPLCGSDGGGDGEMGGVGEEPIATSRSPLCGSDGRGRGGDGGSGRRAHCYKQVAAMRLRKSG